MRTLAFGDIHGCFTSLETVWNEVKPSVDDHVVMLGDYVDRGLQTKDVINFLIEKSRSHKIEFLQGNHEFLRTCKPYVETQTHIFVHACVEADQPIDQQNAYTLVHKKLMDEGPHCSGKTIICGHTAQSNHKPLNLGHTLCIDTDAGRDGWVTCLHVETGNYWQADEKATTRSGSILTS